MLGRNRVQYCLVFCAKPTSSLLSRGNASLLVQQYLKWETSRCSGENTGGSGSQNATKFPAAEAKLSLVLASVQGTLP